MVSRDPTSRPNLESGSFAGRSRDGDLRATAEMEIRWEVDSFEEYDQINPA